MRSTLPCGSLLFLLSRLASALAAPPQNFINTAIARTVELGGATTQVTTQYNVKAVTDSPGEYWLALAGEGDEEPAWWEVMVGGKAIKAAVVSDAGSVDCRGLFTRLRMVLTGLQGPHSLVIFAEAEKGRYSYSDADCSPHSLVGCATCGNRTARSSVPGVEGQLDICGQLVPVRC
jgi:hypothetical protein